MTSLVGVLGDELPAAIDALASGLRIAPLKKMFCLTMTAVEAQNTTAGSVIASLPTNCCRQ